MASNEYAREPAKDMANIGASESLAAMHRLKERIETLSEQQAEAMKTAMFKGMTSGEAKKYDNRSSRITKLVKKLATVSKNSPCTATTKKPD
jgi:hypothetical protein